jgi:CRISPR-associated protein Cas1
MDSLYAKALSEDAIRRAWDSVLSSAKIDSNDGYETGVEKFIPNADKKLDRLIEEIQSGTYTPGLLYEVRIAKKSGEDRVLHVPTVPDRIVERAILDVIVRYIDPYLGATSFAYRSGLGVKDAVREVALHRELEYKYVFRSDIDDCFPNLPKKLALAKLMTFLPDRSLNQLLIALVYRRCQCERQVIELQGVAQGTALAPLLSNILLIDLDNAVSELGMHMIRYADDYVVPGHTKDDCYLVQEAISKKLKEFGMKPSPEKTEIMSYKEGFTFLGEEFKGKYPPYDSGGRMDIPEKAVIYAGKQGSHIGYRQNRFIVENREKMKVLDVPINQVGGIVTFGGVGITAAVRNVATYRGIPVTCMSKSGNYVGSFVGNNSGDRVGRLKRQVYLSEDEAKSMMFCREMMVSKLLHQKTILKNFTSPEFAIEVNEAVVQIDNMRSKVYNAVSRAEIMGFEGIAAKHYFGVLGKLLPQDVRFVGRSRRPATNLPNALLNYGYAILLGECISALTAAGLNPHIGLLHADEDGRPSLALDLMEEFRPYIVDQTVIQLLRKGSIDNSHRQKDESKGIIITKQGKQILVSGYEHRMLTITKGALPGLDFKGSLRMHLFKQAIRLAMFIDDPNNNEWSGLSWR